MLHGIPIEEQSPTYLPPDSASFRQVLGRFATGVTVLATLGRNGIHATTANAFTAVSLDPALVLVCLHRQSRLLEEVARVGRFSINILARHQGHVARAMSTKGRDPEQTPGVSWFLDRDGLPLLGEALAHVHCTVEEQVDGGDHQIVIGRVHAMDRHDGEPLVFLDGSFLESWAQPPAKLL
jgi:flavin reductase (DIM6/NTAB) family NADH-FMN oxidoreductase RutF